MRGQVMCQGRVLPVVLLVSSLLAGCVTAPPEDAERVPDQADVVQMRLQVTGYDPYGLRAYHIDGGAHRLQSMTVLLVLQPVAHAGRSVGLAGAAGLPQSHFGHVGAVLCARVSLDVFAERSWPMSARSVTPVDCQSSALLDHPADFPAQR